MGKYLGILGKLKNKDRSPVIGFLLTAAVGVVCVIVTLLVWSNIF
jgi:hypothetical protein